jgi:tetratricopeptide (TPR) repeat protein
VTRALLEKAARLREQYALAEARRCCEEVLERSPGDAAALELMAALAADEGDAEAAMRWAGRAISADPGAAAPHYTLGRTHQAEGRLAEAEASYRKSLALAANQAKAHNNLGSVLQMQGRLAEAMTSFRRALEIDPSLPQAKQNLAAITRDRDALEEAAAGYRRAAAANPADALLWNDLGNVYRELGRHRDALASFAEAIARQPSLAEAHFSMSQVLLLCGEYPPGWNAYEWRWKVKGLNLAMPEFRQPLWNGDALAGATLLLHAEQGLGDTLQFVRYAHLAAGCCGNVLLQCQPQIAGILRSVRGLARVLPRGEPLPPFDAHLPLMSLPRIFRTTLESIPWDGAYIHAEPRRVDAWRSLLAPLARLHVGLVWAGRPEYWDDRKRSISLAMLAPLAQPGVALYSLQWGEAASQAAAPPSGMRITDFGDRIRDFSETAALLACLDVVITVDTAMSHLAGAMGVPTWLLLPQAPEWRWLLERQDSPWYPTMRLFRQDIDGDWSGVMRRLAAAIEKLARS